MSVLPTKLWLIIIAIGHIGLGAGGSYATYGNDELAIIGFFGGRRLPLCCVHAQGQAQARLAAVLCGPMVVWFVLLLLGPRDARAPAPLPNHHANRALGHAALSGVMGWTWTRRTCCGGLNMDPQPKGWLIAFGVLFLVAGTGISYR